MYTKLFLPVVICIVVLSCKSSSERKAIDLIERSIVAHGGADRWEALESVSFEKETQLFFADSSLENELSQLIELRFKPNQEVRMAWEKDSISHKAMFDGRRTRYWLGENEIQNEDFLQSKKRELDAAAYVMTKPFDLLQGEKSLAYLGFRRLPDGKDYESVQVVEGLPESSTRDIWVYFFDPRDQRLAAYSVKTSDHTSLVFNKGMAFQGGLLFPSARTSYRLMENGQLEYVRAEYVFSRFQVR